MIDEVKKEEPIEEILPPQPIENIEVSPNEKNDIEDIEGLFKTQETVPTHTPRKLYEQIVPYLSGTTYRLYWNIKNSWKKIFDSDEYTDLTDGGATTLHKHDHGGLDGLADDDHAQYHNNARGDARYYTETELDAGQLDNRYYTETEVDAFAVKLTGAQTVADVKTFSSFPITPSAAPTTDYQVANKKYVDDNIPGGITFCDTEVYESATGPVNWADLNLSGVIGANTAMVMLRVAKDSGAGAENFYFRTKTADAWDNIYQPYAQINAVSCSYIWIKTSSGGIVEWKAAAGTLAVSIDIVAYII